MSAPIRRAAAHALRENSRAARDALDKCTHIELRKVPKTTTPTDIRRAITHAGLQGVSNVSLVYRWFRPTERAILTLTHSGFLQPNLKALENMTLVGLPITADPIMSPEATPEFQSHARQRGGRGRMEAAQRGIITGNGPDGGVPNNGKNVVVGGLPSRLHMDVFRELLAGFKLAELDEGPDIVRVPPPEEDLSRSTKWLIQMKSVSEAHRLARRLHLRHFQPERHGTEYMMKAYVIY
ncbi:hypothetical protein ONZ45_g19235 [Pleurotus djamor]|nr:hypothetical protein ONZ45_g19235 [Pleurotus djamor]